MKRITVEMLEACNACEDQVDEFARRFPDGVTFGSEADAIAQCVAVSDVFDWDWAADSLLTIPARETYEAAVAPALEAYDEAVAPSLEAARATGLEAYMAVRAPALEAYLAARAPAFASAFYNQEG